ncbi:MAG: pyrroloquinoline quinone biosynthesis peptide chaperone PqqD [Planctomycetota bacterium]|nr:pyrroloquinoline quinone biosynthesis peptide chaperone PqqD [Planctomycetota bacterium]
MTGKSTVEHPHLSPHVRYQWDPVRAQHHLLFPEGVLILNHTSAAIIQRCDGRAIATLITELAAEFPGATLTDDVHDFLQEMTRRGFVRDTTGD